MSGEHVKRILWIQHEGLKAHDARHEFTGSDVVRASNGSGKTAILDAIRLVTMGHTTGVNKTGQGVMTLARPGVDRIRLLLGAELTDGRTAIIERRWARDSKGSVKESIRIDGQKLRTSDGEDQIAALFAGLPEAWDAVSVFRATPEDLRALILALAPATAIKLDDVVPATCPKWAEPKHSDMSPTAWIKVALRMTADKINSAQDERRRSADVLSRLVVGTEIDASTDREVEPIKARLGTLRDELVRCSVSRADRARAVQTERDTRAKLEHARTAAGYVSREAEIGRLVEQLAACLPADRAADLREGAAARALEATAKARVPAPWPIALGDVEVVALSAEIRGRIRRDPTERPPLVRQLAHAKAKLSPVATYPVATREKHAAAKAEFAIVDARIRPIEADLSNLRGELRAITDVAPAAAPTDPLGKAAAEWRGLDQGARASVVGDLREMHEGNEEIARVGHVAAQEVAIAHARVTGALLRLVDAASLEPGADVARDARRADLRARIEALEIDLQLVEGEREEIAAKVMHAEAGVRRAEAEAEIADIQAKIDEIDALWPTFPEEAGAYRGLVARAGEWLDEIEATTAEIVSEALDATVAKAELDAIEEAHVAAVEALAKLPEGQRSREDVEAEIEAVEDALEAATKHNATAEKVREARAVLTKCEANEAALKGWKDTFTAIELDLVKRSKTWFEERYSEMLDGARVEVSLENALGRPDCRVLVDGIPVTTMCPGHQAFALVMFTILLAGIRKSGFRFLPGDELEKIGLEYRGAFLQALQDARSAGQIDQFLWVGCPDGVPAIEGVTVHEMKTRLALIPEEPEAAVDEDAIEPPPPTARTSRRGRAAAAAV